MFCPKCGNKIDISKPFCPDCGEKIEIPKRTQERVPNMVPERIIDYPYYPTQVNGLSISGFIFGIISIIIGIILLVLVTTEKSYNWALVITYIIIGLISGVLAIISLILSIVGLSKRKDAFGIIGTFVSSLTIILNLISVIYFITNID